MLTSSIEVSLLDETDFVYAHIALVQAGLKGLKLPVCWLPEFVEALENTVITGKFCIFQNYFCCNSKKGTEISVYSSDAPLLQLNNEQRAKLISHLRSTYFMLISIYR